MKNQKLLPLMLLVITLSTCQQTKFPTNQGTQPSPTNLSRVMATYRVTITPTQFLTPIIESTSTRVSTEMPDASEPDAEVIRRQEELGLIYQCSVIDYSSNTFHKEVLGTLVLQSTKPDRDLFLFHLPNEELSALPSLGRGSFYNPSVSPDQTRVAYGVYTYSEVEKEISDNLLVIADANGSVLDQMEVQEDENLAIWLDNNHLIFYRDDAPQPVLTGMEPVSIVRNILTGDETVLPTNFPNLYNQVSPYVSWGVFSISRAIYDPSLKYVIYPSREGDQPIGSNGSYTQSIALFDISNNTILHRLLTMNFEYGSYPVWTPDGSGFVAVAIHPDKESFGNGGGYNLFLAATNGEVKQLSHFSNQQALAYQNFSWSPDGKYLAFWLSIPPYPGYRLSVLNIADNIIKDYCILGEDQQKVAAPRPIWSPDSRYLAFASYSLKRENHVETVLLDTTDGSAFSVANSVIPNGWIK